MLYVEQFQIITSRFFSCFQNLTKFRTDHEERQRRSENSIGESNLSILPSHLLPSIFLLNSSVVPEYDTRLLFRLKITFRVFVFGYTIK